MTVVMYRLYDWPSCDNLLTLYQVSGSFSAFSSSKREFACVNYGIGKLKVVKVMTGVTQASFANLA